MAYENKIVTQTDSNLLFTDRLGRDWVVAETPPAFDLGLERERILLTGETAKQSFFDNAHLYIREHLAGEVNVEFAPYFIDRDTRGNVSLTTPGYHGSVSQLYNPARTDWPNYRNTPVQKLRPQTEYQAFSDFERSDELKHAQVGDKFVWFSPPPTEYLNTGDIDKLKSLGYGYHSFIFLYEVKFDPQSNQLYLESRAIRHYLNPETQAILLNSIIGKDIFPDGASPGDLDFLSSIEKIPGEEVDVDNLTGQINNLYQQIPPGLRIGIEDLQMANAVFTDTLHKLDRWLEGIFYLLCYDYFRNNNSLIVAHFRGWENALKAFFAGKSVAITDDDIGNPEQWALEQMQAGKNIVSNLDPYTKQTYKPSVGGCGLGSGFTKTTTYESIENSGKSFTGECPVCGSAVEKLPVGGHCPGCDTQYLCA